MKLKKHSNKLKKKNHTEDIYQNQFKDCLKELENVLKVRNSEREGNLRKKSLDMENQSYIIDKIYKSQQIVPDI